MKNSTRFNKIAFLTLTVLFWASVSFTIPYFAPYATSHGISATLIGIMAGFYGFAQLMLRIPIGIISDKYHCLKLFMIIGLFSQILSSSVCFYPNAVTLFLAKVFSGICVSTWVCYSVYFIEMNKKTRSLKNTSLLNLGNNCGTLVGFLGGGFLMSKLTFNSLLITSIIFSSVGLLIVLKLDNPVYQPVVKERKEYFMPLKDKTVLLAALIAAVMQLIIKGTSTSFTSNYLISLGADNFQVSMINTIVSSGAVMVSMLLASEVSAKIRQTTLLYLSFVFQAVACVTTALTSSVAVVLLTQVLLGMSQGIVFAVAMSLAVSYVSEDAKTTAMGVYQSLYALGITLGPIIMGKLIDIFNNYHMPYMIMSSFTILGFLFTYLISKRIPKSHS